ncbi:flagellar biosynthesis anti-sigma factor FlgM [Treponema sp.]|uniref:flagellar biosynthesis anti-sigma factor FlgM n=1 Tax=Treponema sp. TaxID=166 RepID=UPI001E06144A|nr:flagellar biosynthesis anti-sigma factor FlgM [Treponema sp.]MBS7241004.1 flagellar biosynthesis anti-sigma factor FlgM [Treponema sp.]MCI6442401.1 flagellar biosynthesis anti-sigma factor FlgM [Spirochaetia bacterium]MDY4132067.1 flagellar biosynthesis anti-sigma factor FlgM [Treponema sp.]
MMIDKVNYVSPVNNLQSTKRSNNVANSQRTSDEISVSEEAKAAAEAMYLKQVSDETPDIRQDLVEEIKLKIQDPNFFSDATIAATADRILSAYGL